MKRKEGVPGRISNHFRGLGTVTRDMVTQRAQEIARINGRDHFIEDDWEEAKRELMGITHSEAGEEESIAGLTRWDEEPGSSGRHVPNNPPQDEQTLAEQLVDEGLSEAEHEQMVEGSRPDRNEEI